MIEPLWVEKYRPRSIDDCVLPTSVKTQLEGYRSSKLVPNLILTGRAGIGKTSSIVALLDEMGMDSFILNSSLYGNIDTLRTEVTQYAATISFAGGRKYVVLDEADGLSQATQQGLRNFMEEYASNCGFILTCNYVNKLIEPLRSRTGTIEYRIPKSEAPGLQGRFWKRLRFILDKEGVEYDKDALAGTVIKYFPDWRRVINEVQRYANGHGKIDSGILVNVTDEAIATVLALVKAKKFSEMRNWVTENADIEPAEIFTKIYDQAYKHFDEKSVPLVVHTINEYQKSASVVANQEINVAAFLTVLMADAAFKN